MLKSCRAQSGQAYQGIHSQLNDELADVGEGGWGGEGAERVYLLKFLTKIRDSLILNVVLNIKHQTRFLLSLNERTIRQRIYLYDNEETESC